MKNISIFLILIFVTSVHAQHGPSPVFTKKARTAEIENRQKVTGSLSAPKISDVAGIEDGRVEEILIKRGDSVKAGDLLLVLDNRRIKHDIEITKAQFAEIDAALERSKSELAIQKKDLEALHKANQKFAGSVSDKDIRAAQLKIASSTGNISELEARKPKLNAELKKLATSLEDTSIKAPFDGVILERYTEKGAWLAKGGKIAKLQSFDLKAAIDIPESIKPELLTENSVKAFVEAGKKELKLSNFKIIREVDKESRNYLLLATIEQDKNLLPGMSLSAEVPTAVKQKQLLIPSDAIQRNGASYFVYKVIPGQKGTSAMPVMVQVLFKHGSETAVISPMISEGDDIIVEGNERLFPMMPVKASEK